MQNHVVCYVQRKRVTDWKRLVITHDEPVFVYGSRDDFVFPKQLKDGGTLWVISSQPDRPPALTARLSVKVVLPRQDPALGDFGVSQRFLRHFSEFKWIAVGDEQSEFFGYNDAGSALLNTTFESPSGELRLLDRHAENWQTEFGSKLQRPAKVSAVGLRGPTGIAALQQLAATKARSVFISYKWRDNTKRMIRELAYALARQGFMPWLDQLALPKSKALGLVEKDEEKLEKLLCYGYRQCFAVLGIESPNYGVMSEGSDKNWTLREWEGALAPQKSLTKVVYNPKGAKARGILADAHKRLAGQSPDSAAQELKEWYTASS